MVSLGFFIDLMFPLPLALWSTQPVTDMSTWGITWWVKAFGLYGWEALYFHVPIF
jgi:hypothetical protein